ncbi:GNAT family N-acetyltransferase [Sphingomonas sp. 7/4-4]|uniref:GNAT family N-acetyltransferase n=1 Tax=Sphingomonas sp. 7/4-4 TaxID=3018446 RepID=UPI0022F39B1E|nr:GNAT family N-acetyltransferase [Sphingomonas sp. 7/4-4]WBY08117.1 GNAT family N-acetyltransferase [Sphingomonas sp. 7/4-4]
MFVRTQRLTLRPGWTEDAPELARAIGHEEVVRNLARAPWPYTIEAAETFASSFEEAAEPKFLIFEHQGSTLRLIGAISVGPFEDEPHELGYWLTPDAWGRGYATEAGAAVLRAARSAESAASPRGISSTIRLRDACCASWASAPPVV